MTANNIFRGDMVRYAVGFIIVSLMASSILFLLYGVNPLAVMRVIFGLVFVMFLPGYILCRLMFPDDQEISGVERLGLSLGLSMPLSMSAALLADQFFKIPLTAWNIVAVIGILICILGFASVVAPMIRLKPKVKKI
jgi:uncharacterized membrane protein